MGALWWQRSCGCDVVATTPRTAAFLGICQAAGESTNIKKVLTSEDNSRADLEILNLHRRSERVRERERARARAREREGAGRTARGKECDELSHVLSSGAIKTRP